MKHKTVRDMDRALFSYFTPHGSVLIGLIIFFGVVAMLTMTGCATTPEEINAKADKINMIIDERQAGATRIVEEQAAIAEAAKQAAKAIADNLKESVEGVVDTVKESIEGVTE